MYFESTEERARRTDPSSGLSYRRLSYAIAIAVHALRMIPRVVFRTVEAATNPDVAREELAEPQGPTIAELVADGTLSPPRDVSAECSEAEVAPAKRKRVRVRSPKLYACDVETGGVYVPKRGNDKTPNFVVSVVSLDDDEMVNSVWYHRANESVFNAVHAPVEDFLAIVARRVDA